MLPVCSATTCCSCHTKVLVPGGLKSLSPYSKTFDVNCNNVDKVVFSFSNGVHLDRASFRKRPASCFYSNYIGNSEKSVSIAMNDQSLYQNGLGNLKKLTQSSYLRPNGMIFVDSSSNSAGNDQIMDFISNTTENTDILPNYADPELIMSLDGVPIDPPLILDSSNLDVNSLTDIVSEMNESTAEIINEGENVLSNLFGNVTSSVTTSLTNANEAVDSVINEIVSFINKSGESAGNKLTGISSELKEASGKAGFVALDVIRRTIIVVEDSLIQGAKTVGYAYSSSKEFLPSEFQEVLNLSEESVAKVLNPAGNAFRQVYMAVEGFEESIGLDPNDPLIPFVLFLGLSATLWGSYRILKYSGYAGDLSPQSTLELLRGNENVVLVDIRPEARDCKFF